MFYNKFLIILIILLLFIFINYICSIQENMSINTPSFKKNIIDNGYTLDVNTFRILDAYNNVIKEYPTRYFNSKKSHYIAKNKPLTNSILLKNNIPTPKHYVIEHKNKHSILNSKKTYPCVLKPVDGMQGKDVYTHIDNDGEFNKILDNLMKTYDNVMMEELVYGNNYRIFVFNNKVMDIIEREKPFIIGNGKSTVQELINNKNKTLKEKKLFIVKYIDEKLIKQQNYELSSILPLNVKLFITNTINFHNGANPKRIDLDKVPKVNIDLFINAHTLIGLECSGVDYMSEDIYTPYYKNKGSIIEMNDMVDAKIHVDADNKKNKNFLFKNMVKSLM